MVELCAGRRRAAAVALPRAVAVAVANNSMALPPIFYHQRVLSICNVPCCLIILPYAVVGEILPNIGTRGAPPLPPTNIDLRAAADTIKSAHSSIGWSFFVYVVERRRLYPRNN